MKHINLILYLVFEPLPGLQENVLEDFHINNDWHAELRQALKEHGAWQEQDSLNLPGTQYRLIQFTRR